MILRISKYLLAFLQTISCFCMYLYTILSGNLIFYKLLVVFLQSLHEFLYIYLFFYVFALISIYLVVFLSSAFVLNYYIFSTFSHSTSHFYRIQRLCNLRKYLFLQTDQRNVKKNQHMFQPMRRIIGT